MAVTVTHATVATGTDAGNGEIRKSHWNANHTVVGAAGLSDANTFTASQTISVTGGQVYMQVSGGSGQDRAFQLATNGLNRWVILAENTAETGSNAGSNFTLNRYSDAGSYIGSAININRSTGLTTLEALNVTGALRTGSKYVPYAFAQSGTAVSVGAVTTEAVLATISFAGGELGPNGYIQVIPHFSCTNNANVKTGFVRLGGAAGTQYMSTTLTSLAGVVRYVSIFNNNSQSAQKSPSPAGQGVGFGTFSSVGVTSTVNTASAWDLVISAQKANAGDTLKLEGYQILVCYGA